MHVPLLTQVPQLVFAIYTSSEFSVLPQAVTSLVFKLVQDQQLLAGGRDEGETQLQFLVFIILPLAPSLLKGADTHLEQPPCILSFLDPL